MPLKKQEEFCRDEFDLWLRDRFPRRQIVWEDNVNDPPDFWLILESQRYAVEITCIVDEESRTAARSLWRIVENAESEAKRLGDLSGKYLVIFNGRIDKGHGKLRNKLQAMILDYVKRTANLEADGPELIPVGAQPFCKIKKLDGRGAKIFAFGGPDETGIAEVEIRRELTQILTRSLTAKSKIPRDTKCPTVLVLYDLYWQVDQELFMQCLNEVEEKTAFHTVYVVQDKGSGFLGCQDRPF